MGTVVVFLPIREAVGIGVEVAVVIQRSKVDRFPPIRHSVAVDVSARPVTDGECVGASGRRGLSELRDKDIISTRQESEGLNAFAPHRFGVMRAVAENRIVGGFGYN